MRILSLVFSFLVTASVVTGVLAYLERRVGQQRIYVQEQWLSSSDEKAYHSYGDVSPSESDTTRIALDDSLPQR